MARRDASRIAREQGLRDMHDDDIDPNTGKSLKPSDNVEQNVFSNPNLEGS
jgi:hypothetical protein